ncbi:DNA polymerase-like protein epsilon subunit C [Tricharina praecox]|uniref:DNA polymerase-like protein epsilon subunit C n=1 Tax=Tricharina praecox TaxID=43433 RepID=UPI00221E9DD6|nr:DNA polymerase-like protein epsilon subunit C [Tricharina praecox]KAI5849100.1 DNA polymerase-like protein epsilon subunit C [Tricharina praecox]
MQAPPPTSPPPGAKPKATRRRRNVKTEVVDDPSDSNSSSGNNQTASPPVPSIPSANAPRYVHIKTKFPVARIKRIMQADEDVGKVAQVTPVVVNKALELFMISLCDKASEEARLRNSKRITAGHLKQAILHVEQFDFLADIIQKIADIPAPSAEGANLTNNGSDSPEDVQPAKKTRRPRQKKVKDEDAF